MKDLQNNENEEENKLAYFDIETTDIDPRNNRVLTVAILYGDDDEAQIVGNQGEAEGIVLRRVSSWLSDPISYVSFSGSRFDKPFLNYRLKVHRLPTLDIYHHIDVQKMLPHQSNGHPASLEKECMKRGIISKSTPFNESLWRLAKRGDPKAVAAVGQHNIEDVFSLRELYRAIKREQTPPPDPIEVLENEGGYHEPPLIPWDTAWLARVRPKNTTT